MGLFHQLFLQRNLFLNPTYVVFKDLGFTNVSMVFVQGINKIYKGTWTLSSDFFVEKQSAVAFSSFL